MGSHRDETGRNKMTEQYDESLEAWSKRLDERSLLELAQLQVALRNQLDQVKRVEADLRAKLDRVRIGKIPLVMESMEVDTITFSDVGRIVLRSDMWTSIPSETKPQAYKWLRDQGYGDLIQPAINPSTFKAFAKEATRNGIVLPEEYFKITPYTMATITKVRGSSK